MVVPQFLHESSPLLCVGVLVVSPTDTEVCSSCWFILSQVFSGFSGRDEREEAAILGCTFLENLLL